MEFTPVTEADIPKRSRGAGGASATLVDNFIASGVSDAVVNLDADKKVESVRATLGNYVKRHELPVKVYTVSGQLYLKRGDQYAAEHRAANANGNATASATAQTAPSVDDLAASS